MIINQFVSKKSHELNQVFENFKNEGVSEMVIDLRYNGAGSIKNCVELASMITGQFTNEIFAEEQWNNKLLPYLRNNFGVFIFMWIIKVNFILNLFVFKN